MSEGVCGGFAASSEVCNPEFAKGFFGAVTEVVENGFEGIEFDVLVEKGFPEDVWDEGLAPNRVSPMLTEGLDGGTWGGASMGLRFLSSVATSEILTPRSTLTLPSIRLHAFRRQLNT